MRTERVMHPNMCKIGDTLVIVPLGMDVSPETLVETFTEWSRLYLDDDDVEKYIQNSEICKVIDVDEGVTAETLDKSMVFCLGSEWKAEDEDEYMVLIVR